ncbi:hypothetical protein [Gilliamella sp. BG7]|uniref:hypothetical protein n=1 Tax=unclassified Gilliamella TaxID=2685620 RepID=UPI0039867AB0
MAVKSNILKSNISKLMSKVSDIDKDETIVCKALRELYGLVERLNQLQVDDLREREILLVQNFANRFITKQNRNQLSKNELSSFSLLKDILMATYIVKTAYNNIVKSAHRTEAELAALVEDIENIKKQKEEYADLLSTAFKLKELESEINDAEESLGKIEAIKEQVNDNINSISEILETSNEEIKEIKSNKLESNRLIQEIENNKDLMQEQLENIADSQKAHEKISNDLEKLCSETEKKFNTQKIEIQNIIDDANRASMAGSFKSRKDEVTKSIRWLDGFTYGALTIIFLMSLYLFYSSYSDKTFSLIHFISKIPITFPLVWLAWLTSRKSAYLMRIREDYAYKYSSAMAFEGYKKQVQEISPDLLAQLLDIAVTNLGDNPIRLFDKKVKHTPINYEELLVEAKKLTQDQLDALIKTLSSLNR